MPIKRFVTRKNTNDNTTSTTLTTIPVEPKVKSVRGLAMLPGICDVLAFNSLHAIQAVSPPAFYPYNDVTGLWRRPPVSVTVVLVGGDGGKGGSVPNNYNGLSRSSTTFGFAGFTVATIDLSKIAPGPLAMVFGSAGQDGAFTCGGGGGGCSLLTDSAGAPLLVAGGGGGGGDNLSFNANGNLSIVIGKASDKVEWKNGGNGGNGVLKQEHGISIPGDGGNGGDGGGPYVLFTNGTFVAVGGGQPGKSNKGAYGVIGNGGGGGFSGGGGGGGRYVHDGSGSVDSSSTRSGGGGGGGGWSSGNYAKGGTGSGQARTGTSGAGGAGYYNPEKGVTLRSSGTYFNAYHAILANVFPYLPSSNGSGMAYFLWTYSNTPPISPVLVPIPPPYTPQQPAPSPPEQHNDVYVYNATNASSRTPQVVNLPPNTEVTAYVVGGKGGATNSFNGDGAGIVGTFTANGPLSLYVGQAGSIGNYVVGVNLFVVGGGGGCSAIVDSTNKALIVAAGGGGNGNRASNVTDIGNVLVLTNSNITGLDYHGGINIAGGLCSTINLVRSNANGGYGGAYGGVLDGTNPFGGGGGGWENGASESLLVRSSGGKSMVHSSLKDTKYYQGNSIVLPSGVVAPYHTGDGYIVLSWKKPGTSIAFPASANLYKYTGTYVTVPDPIQVTVPTGAKFVKAYVAGAQGGSLFGANLNYIYSGGSASSMIGSFPVTEGEKYNIYVGNTGFPLDSTMPGLGGGGGGCSAITDSAGNIMMVAAGGGGCAFNAHGGQYYPTASGAIQKITNQPVSGHNSAGGAGILNLTAGNGGGIGGYGGLNSTGHAGQFGGWGGGGAGVQLCGGGGGGYTGGIGGGIFNKLTPTSVSFQPEGRAGSSAHDSKVGLQQNVVSIYEPKTAYTFPCVVDGIDSVKRGEGYVILVWSATQI